MLKSTLDFEVVQRKSVATEDNLEKVSGRTDEQIGLKNEDAINITKCAVLRMNFRGT